MPPLALRWSGLRIDERHLARYRRLCGADGYGHIPFLYPLSMLFHYHLGLFGHADFPWPLKKMLGLRNHVVQHRLLRPEDRLDLEVRTGSQRALPKGLEFDFHSVLSEGGRAVWESTHVYYLRGDFGPPSTAALDYLQPLEASEMEASWPAPAGGGLEFARLCGDFNPVHFSAGWARMLGFPRPFSHTQRIIDECLGRLPDAVRLDEAGALRLDVAFKGPIYYGRALTMKAARRGAGWRFDLYCADAPKPAMPGRILVGTQAE